MRLIDADALNRKKKYSFETVHGVFPKNEWFIKADDLFRAPTIDPVKHGRWYDVYMASQQTVAQTCSCCENTIIMNIAHHFNYCPACGARMDADE